MATKALGLDVGGTKTEAVIVDKDGTILDKKRVPTERDKGHQFVLKKIADLVREVKDGHKIIGIGAGLPGAIHPQSNLMINGNSHIFVGKNFIEDLRGELNYDGPVKVANDANCFALAETLFGVGKEIALERGETTSVISGFGVILGTGCGGGFIHRGEIFPGVNGGAAEVGHTLIGDEGRKCYCGKLDCAETYLSGPGLQASYKNLSETEAISAQDIFEQIDTNPFARSVIDEYQDKLATLISHIASNFDPHFIVLGGGVSLQHKIYEGLEQRVRKKLFIERFPPKIKKHLLGDSAGAIGAASLVLPFET